MPRRRPPVPSMPAAVRAWLGLTQTELALYLGVSQTLLQAIEAGQRALTPAVYTALRPLLLQLPGAGTAAAPAPGAALPPGTPAPDAPDLAFRGRVCRHRAAGLLAQAEALAARAHVAARWAAALPALLPPAEDEPPPDTPAAQALAAALAQAADPHDPARAADHARWLRGWLAHRARPLSAAEATRCHRLRARAAGLLAEAAALEAGTSATT